MSEKRSYHDLQPEFDEALRLRDEGRLVEAETVLLRLVNRRPDVAAVHGMLGHVEEALGGLTKAAASYRRAT
ncbi:MAG: hypothetical protein ACRDUX_23765, partial [Mycobacterium sp.]